MATNAHQPPIDDRDIHRTPFGLAYLVFVFLPLIFPPQRTASAALASLLAAALFIPLYLRFHKLDPRRQAASTMATALLGYALIPFNGGGNTFIIYALAMAAQCMAVRTAIVLAVLLVAVMGAEFWLIMPGQMYALWSVVVVAVIGTLAIANILYLRARAWRNAELRLTQDEVRRLAAVAERERIGRDLHDLLGHTLSVVALKSELAGKLLDHDPAAARSQIREVEDVARHALAQVREAVAGIRATGLPAELAAARLALLSADVRLDQRVAPVTLDSQVELAFTMALREAVTNIIRHASARRVEVELTADDCGTRLLIADDGRGGIARHGNGLAGMRERLLAIGGELEVDSPPGAGTRLAIRGPKP
ncbi:sensor histidine kinase [Methylococcus sp. EFPC2]|uniref:sensor histidine kinase n=1 Tax=Methylococcus sp. EFPC2 TaxID=2812648 RepID=UPI0019670BCD|nr:sensor histidine kinase [Methylococcus sp. EFPC2]QSA97253.1 sensor histidine kinase [Methylococcus sp. EFPC2]